MAIEYNYLNCQSLFGYAMKVHERSGGICQLCGAGKDDLNFDLWRQMSVEHILGRSRGGYNVLNIVNTAFSHLDAHVRLSLANRIEEANTVTACSFCNSTTSQFEKNGETLSDMLERFVGEPNAVVNAVISEIEKVLDRKRHDVAWKLASIRKAYESHIAPTHREGRVSKSAL